MRIITKAMESRANHRIVGGMVDEVDYDEQYRRILLERDQKHRFGRLVLYLLFVFMVYPVVLFPVWVVLGWLFGWPSWLVWVWWPLWPVLFSL